MNVKLIYRNKEYEVPAGMTVRDAIKKVGLQPETVLAVHNGKLMTDDTILKAEMKQIKLVAVISGGSPLPYHPSTPAPLRFGGYRARCAPFDFTALRSPVPAPQARPRPALGRAQGASPGVQAGCARRFAQETTREGGR